MSFSKFEVNSFYPSFRVTSFVSKERVQIYKQRKKVLGEKSSRTVSKGENSTLKKLNIFI